jgi:GNAT superfamily N-acetyltransferase
MHALARICVRYQTWGFQAFFKWVVVRILQRVLRWEYLLFYCKILGEEDPKYRAKIAVHFKIANRTEIKTLLQASPQLLQKAEAELQQGCECIVGSVAGQIVFSVWIDYHRIYEPGVMNFRLKNRQAYIYRMFTQVDFRGLGIALEGYQFIFKRFKQHKISQCFVSVNFENAASICTIRKNGFRKVGALSFIRFGKRSLILSKQSDFL